ncbi:carboxypeptidase-like regulatory domain-containing protein [Desulfogranum japonicum]|uniref:carboxypeptidase-like regulatory domain-containing protein n=1 Tax=Desulfogranum japonicum TaxID=231447 RepID=UPI000409F2D1|nr:carboxypeptidase-like regulatory domain-containing protein [Desulfogranum japonicum]
MENQRFLTIAISYSVNSLLKGLFFLSVFICGGCATSTTFRVLDVETNKPIEGAVALAEWVGGENMGLVGPTFAYTAKVVEVVTDSNGNFSIPGTLGRLALQTPHLKIYKAGYVGWDSRFVYLGYYAENWKLPRLQERKSFLMKDQAVYMQTWKDEYSFISHGRFIDSYADFSKVGIDDSKYQKAIRHEIPFEIEELKSHKPYAQIERKPKRKPVTIKNIPNVY